MINKRFNEELQKQITGTLPIGHVYQLGRPGEILRAAGILDLEIELSAAMLIAKSDPNYVNPHPFNLSDIRNLPNAIQYPIMVFDSKTRTNNKVILTELKSNGVNFVVALEMNYKKGRPNNVVPVNSIRSVYPKSHFMGVVSWVNDGLLRYADKEKATDYIQRNGAQPAPKSSVNSTVANFPNPTATANPTPKQRRNSAEVGDRIDRNNTNIGNPKQKVNT